MKNYAWVGCLALVLMLTACAKSITQQDLPSGVSTEFIKRYAGARNVEWKIKKNVYTAKFKMNEAKFTVKMDESGNVVAVDQK